jgi:hypothetical protein
VKAWGNGREELAFPAPANELFYPIRDFAGHMSPASSGRVVPPCEFDQEVRRRAASIHDAKFKKWRESNKPAASRVTPIDPMVLEIGVNTVGQAKTESYYCEPVWWSVNRRF